MKPIFGRGPSLPFRLFLAVILSASLMLADSRLDTFTNVRFFLNTLVAPIQYAADFPRVLVDSIYERARTWNELIETNRSLRNETLYLQSELTLLAQYKEENQRFRKLLDSDFIRDEVKEVTEVMAVDNSPYRHQIVIDKGSIDGVYVGQPIINDKGIVGQVTFVSAHNSRVLLLTDKMAAIPVQVIRNDIRVIASGNGKINEMQLEHVPTNTDIEVGDVLVSSGLGGVFPEGYPVAHVSKVIRDTHNEFAQITVEPTVDFEKLRYLLLVWSKNGENASPKQAKDPAFHPMLPEVKNNEN